MNPELGNLALMFAFSLAVVQGAVPLVGAWRGNARWMSVARAAAAGQFAFVTLAFGLLVQAFAVNDFSVAYVAQHANLKLPLHYRLAATWGGHEGSLLLWVQILALWTLAVALCSRRLPPDMAARVLGVMGLISVGFLGFMLFTSNPFERQWPPAPDGRDLNPLLQDAGMIFHPPLLYMGYVGFSVAFGFAMAALLGGRLDAQWARWSRPWTLLAWVFLTLGIFLGSFWAYYELGWGGWWFWDAVENASFMPWLVGTALIHSLAVSEKRGSFRNWTVLLAILAFSLSLLGTFLVRSGVLTSVHAFATDPERGSYILAFLVVVIGGALGLYAWRAPTIGLGGRFSLFSREALLMANNVLLAAAAGTVLLGTLYPLALDALGLGKISVGPPYFDSVFVPLMLPMLLLVAIAPFVAWKQGSWPRAWRPLRLLALGALVLGAALVLAAGTSVMVAAGVSLALWVVLGTGAFLVQRLGAAGGARPWWRRAMALPGGEWGMLAAHAGLGVFVLGVTLAKGLESAQDVRLRVGETAQAGPYRLTFSGIEQVQGPNYTAARARFDVHRGVEPVAVLHPEKRLYTVQQTVMTEAAIDRGLTRDLYVSLGEAAQGGGWLVRVQHKPFMGWIWAGALIMALGGLLAAADRRYRRPAPRTAGIHPPPFQTIPPAEPSALPARPGVVPGASA